MGRALLLRDRFLHLRLRLLRRHVRLRCRHTWRSWIDREAKQILGVGISISILRMC